jgi:hypothetical protein
MLCEMFLGTQKEDDRGPLSVQSSLRRSVLRWGGDGGGGQERTETAFYRLLRRGGGGGGVGGGGINKQEAKKSEMSRPVFPPFRVSAGV